MTINGSTTTLVFLHCLGGSAESWKLVGDLLEPDHRCLRLDLPGFGDAAADHGYSVSEMADRIAAMLAGEVIGRWVLVAHSMSAKVALLIARRAQDRAQDGAAGLDGLAGLVLTAGSPPAPEPIADDKRAEMLGWFDGDADRSRAEAERFVNDNVASPLPPALHRGAVEDVLRAARPAWRAWLEHGSNEDLRHVIGRLSLPALILAGAADAALGAEAQRALMAPHLADARLMLVSDAAHLLPLEQPERVAELIAQFVAGADAGGGLIASALITGRTRAVLAARASRDDPDRLPLVLGQRELTVLRKLLDLILPCPPGLEIDLALRLDAMLHRGAGDGWRFAALPDDRTAWRQALARLDAVTLDADAVSALADGEYGAEMTLWFQDLCGDAARLFMAHPAVQERIGCIAVETGGDAALVGFVPETVA